MQRLEVSGAVRPLYASLGFKGLNLSSHEYFLYVERCLLRSSKDYSANARQPLGPPDIAQKRVICCSMIQCDVRDIWWRKFDFS